MTDMQIKPPKPADVTLAEDVFRKMDEQDAALPPAKAAALEAAFELIGNELARREVLTRRKGDPVDAQRLMAGLWGLNFAQSALRDEMLLNDFLRDAEDLREDLATLPPADPADDDPWIMNDE